MVVFQALTWETEDDDECHLIHIFGKTQDGRSVCVTTEFQPYFFVKLPRDNVKNKATIWFNKMCDACPDLILSYNLVKYKDVWGFQNNEEFYYMKIDCQTLADRRKIVNKLRHKLPDELRKLKVFESNLDPVLRLMHRTGIQSTGWMDTGDLCTDNDIANVDIDLVCPDWKQLKPVDKPETAPFVVASIDIECNSSTGKFPDADIEGDACDLFIQ